METILEIIYDRYIMSLGILFYIYSQLSSFSGPSEVFMLHVDYFQGLLYFSAEVFQDLCLHFTFAGLFS